MNPKETIEQNAIIQRLKENPEWVKILQELLEACKREQQGAENARD